MSPEQAPAQDAAEERRAVLLCVDDEQNILSALRRVFRTQPYEVLLADGGERGLELLAEHPVDLVISDMRMPGMDGAAFLERVCAQWPDVVRILLTGHSDVSATVDAINRGQIFQYVSKPWDDDHLRLLVKRGLDQKHLVDEKRRLERLTRKQNEQLKQLNAGLEDKVRARTAELEQTAAMVDAAYGELKKSYTDTVVIFAGLLNMRESTRRNHAQRVAERSRDIAVALELAESAQQDVFLAGMVHDIGKIALPDHILDAPYRSLSGKDLKAFQEHTRIGERALVSLEPLREAAAITRSHHERFDGGGYPEGLRGAEIPIGARIVAVMSDYYDLMAGELVDGMASASEARAFISSHAGTRYDPHVVKAFLEVVPEDDEIPADTSAELRLVSTDLRPGMVLSRDLFHFDGVLLLRAGYRLTDIVIERIESFEHDAGRNYVIYVSRPQEETA